MTPLFIDTQSTLATQTQALPDQSTLRDGGVSMSAQLRMTVDVHQFTATQAGGQQRHFTYFILSFFVRYYEWTVLVVAFFVHCVAN